MTRARGRGRGVTRGRSLSQPGRGVRGGVRGRVRDRRSTGLVQLQVDLLNQQAAQENEAGLDDMVVDPHPPSPNNATSDGEWDWEEDHTSQRVEQGGARGNIIGTAEQVGNEEQNNEGEQILLADRLYPEVPVPRDVNEEDGDGWCLIDRVGAWDAMLCEFQVLEDIPAQHIGTWVWAWNTVLQRVQAADSGLELDRALMWLCFLPQSLLRHAKRGGKAGRKLVAQRFNSLVKGDWGNLVKLWEKDRSALREEQKRRGTKREERADSDRETRQAVELIAKGQVSKAMNRMNSHGMASMADPRVMAQVKAKYPARGRALPARVTKGKPVENLKGLRDSLLKLEGGKSPGTGGLRAEFLIVLAEKMDEEQMELLESFGMRYMGGDLPPWFYKVWLTVMTVPLFKNADQEAVRPLGVRNPFAKSFHKEGVTQNKEEFVDFLEPEQLAMSVAGGGKLVFSVRMLGEERRDFVAVKIDMENAFNAVSRASIIEGLEEEPSLQHLAGLAAVVLAPAHGLEAGGHKWGESAEGATQGDPVSAPFFNIAWHKEVRKLDMTLKNLPGMSSRNASCPGIIQRLKSSAGVEFYHREPQLA